MKPRPRFAAMLSLTILGCGAEASLGVPHSWRDHYFDELVSPHPTTRLRVAVLPFQVSDRVSSETDLRVGDILTTALFETGRFELIERDRLDEVLSEQRLAALGIVDSTTAATVGKILGANAVVFGNLSSATQQKIDRFAYDQLVTKVRIDARATDVTTGEIMFADAAEGVSEFNIITDSHGKIIVGAQEAKSEFAKAAADATESLGQKLAARFPLVGFVISRDSYQIVTDLGADKQIAVGDKLLVMRPLGRVAHPITGQLLWNKLILGQATIEVLDGSTSQASLRQREDTRESVKPGDMVVLNRD